MRLRVLGSAAGGGFPQWNCACRVCAIARAGGPASPRTQSSIAVRGAEGPWLLVNASPDLRAQIEALPAEPDGGGEGIRSSPFGGVVLTDAEIDHTAGLLLLRESSRPLDVWCTEAVRRSLTDDYPLLRLLESYAGVRWHPLVPGTTTTIAGTSLELEPFAVAGDAPLYARAPEGGAAAVGLTVRDRRGGGTLTYAPAIASLDPPLRERLARSDCALVDGTFWTADELVAQGIGSRDAHAMGHQPLSGPDGSLATLAGLPARVVLIHLNNSNPVLIDDGPERAEVDALGIEIAVDGLEIELA